ncbi:hypothetical protein BDZ91DRAFT_1248 [Kalaharituber pfeilii]|nr:hypothetical protein BDZ91DRAFT_1248 [Kalaharituber pfeilii]
MDRFYIYMRITGFLSLAIEIGNILKEYLNDFVSAPKEAHTLVTEVDALSHALQQLLDFLLKENIRGSFEETSVLYIIISICDSKIKKLHSKLTKFHLRERWNWPFQKQDCSEVVSTLHHCAQTLEFSLTISNCELLSKTTAEVITSLSEQRKGLDSVSLLFQTVPDGIQKMSNTLDVLLAFLPKVDEIYLDVKAIKCDV